MSKIICLVSNAIIDSHLSPGNHLKTREPTPYVKYSLKRKWKSTNEFTDSLVPAGWENWPISRIQNLHYTAWNVQIRTGQLDYEKCPTQTLLCCLLKKRFHIEQIRVLKTRYLSQRYFCNTKLLEATRHTARGK